MGSLDGEEGGFRRRLQIFVFFFAVCRCGGILLQCATAQTSKKLIFDWLFVRKSNKYLRICFLPCRFVSFKTVVAFALAPFFW